jgi:hypothetical protein
MRGKRHYLCLASCLLMACGAVNNDSTRTEPPVQPAAPIPTHVLTEDHAGETVEAEAGDWVEVRLPEEVGAARSWQPQGEHGLEVEGPASGKVVDGEEGAVRVFRYRASALGESWLRFGLVGPESGGTAERSVTFALVVR